MNRIVSLESMKATKEYEPIVLGGDDPLSGERDDRNVIENGRFENAEFEFGPLVPWGILQDQPEQEIELHEYENGFAALIPTGLSLVQSVPSGSFKESLKFRISLKAKASVEPSSKEARNSEARWKFTFQTDTATGSFRMVSERYCGNGWSEYSHDFERDTFIDPIINAWFFIGVAPNHKPLPIDPKGIWFTDIKVIPLD